MCIVFTLYYFKCGLTIFSLTSLRNQRNTCTLYHSKSSNYNIENYNSYSLQLKCEVTSDYGHMKTDESIL